MRNRLGLRDSEYQRVEALKRRVLDLAIEQINKNTDIKASYEQHKQGQKIKGFTFKFKCKPTQKPTEQLEQRDPHTLDMFVPMTDNQRFAFAKKKSLVFQRLPTWRKGKQMPVMMLLPSKSQKTCLMKKNRKFIKYFW